MQDYIAMYAAETRSERHTLAPELEKKPESVGKSVL